MNIYLRNHGTTVMRIWNPYYSNMEPRYPHTVKHRKVIHTINHRKVHS